mgnify:CR=1 FL=1
MLPSHRTGGVPGTENEEGPKMLFIPRSAALSREQLHKVPVTPRGDRSDRWMGIKHGDLADAVVERANALGLKVNNESWATGNDGAQLFGKLRLSPTEKLEMDIPKGMNLVLGIRHSNDGSYALNFLVGGEVLVCANGMILEVFAPGMSRRHTTGVVLKATIEQGLAKFAEAAKTALAKEVSALQKRELTVPRADRLLVEAGVRGVVPWSMVGKVEALWRTPPHPEFKDRNAWSMFNAFTEAAKEYPPYRQIEVIRAARELVLDVSKN